MYFGSYSVCGNYPGEKKAQSERDGDDCYQDIVHENHHKRELFEFRTKSGCLVTAIMLYLLFI